MLPPTRHGLRDTQVPLCAKNPILLWANARAAAARAPAAGAPAVNCLYLKEAKKKAVGVRARVHSMPQTNPSFCSSAESPRRRWPANS